MRIARASSFIPEGEAEHRRKSTFRIGNIWIITSVRHTPSGQQRYFIEIVNRYRGLAVASRHVGILYAVTTPVSSVIFPGRRRRFLSSRYLVSPAKLRFHTDAHSPFNFTVNEIPPPWVVFHRLWNGIFSWIAIFHFKFNFQNWQKL